MTGAINCVPSASMSELSGPDLQSFWDLARFHAKLNPLPTYFPPTGLEMVPPPAWSFGASPEQADRLLALVLDGTKTATAGAWWDYQADELPTVGTLSILLDGAGHPRALIVVTDVRVVPFDEVDAEHARLEGEGDLSVDSWRSAHEDFFSSIAGDGQAFSRDMPVVLERFEVVYQ